MIVITWRNPKLKYTEGYSYIIGSLAKAFVYLSRRSNLNINVKVLCINTLDDADKAVNECSHSIRIPISTNSMLNGMTLGSTIAALVELLFSSSMLLEKPFEKKIIVTGNAFKGIPPFTNSRTKMVLTLLSRHELKTSLLRYLYFNAILTFSREVELIARRYFGSKSLFLSYPPINLRLFKPSTKRRNEFLSNIGVENIITYLGRLNETRFPLSTFYLLVKNIKKVPDTKIVIVGLPDDASLYWSKIAYRIIEKANAGNKSL